MADSQVLIKIAAALGNMGGISQAKEQIESLREPVDNFVSSLRGIAEVTGAAFAIEKIADWGREVAEAAEKLSIMADGIGTTAAKLSEFQNIMKLAGGESGNLVRIMSAVGKSLQKAVNEPLSAQSYAADQAGIKLTELAKAIQDGPLAQVELLRQAWNNLAGNSNRLEIFRDLAGSPRLFQQLLPYLELTNEELEKLKAKAAKTGANLSDAEAKTLKEIAEQIDELDTAFDGLKKHIILGFQQPIKESLKAATEFVEYRIFCLSF